MNKTYSLITGGDTGIGICLAEELAKRGKNLVLVSKNEDKLLKAFSDLQSKYPEIEVKYEVVDLVKNENVIQLAERYFEQIDVLINNAGFGKWGFLENINSNNLIDMIQVNIVAVVFLTKLLTSSLAKHNGFILNLSSEASYSFIPKFAVYGATKAFISYFSETVRREYEMQNYNIAVTTLLPKATDTNFFNSAEMTEEEKEKLFKIEKPSTPEEVAKEAIEGMFSKKPFVVIGGDNQFKMWMAGIQGPEKTSQTSMVGFSEIVDR